MASRKRADGALDFKPGKRPTNADVEAQLKKLGDRVEAKALPLGAHPPNHGRGSRTQIRNRDGARLVRKHMRLSEDSVATLAHLAWEERKTETALMEEALDDLFAKRSNT